MRPSRRLILLLAPLILFGCQTFTDFYGKGPITLTPRVEQGYREYLSNEGGAFAFAVSTTGRSYGYIYCKGGSACAGLGKAAYDAISHCEAHSNGVPCKLYDFRGNIVWEGAKEPADEANRSVASGIPDAHLPTREKILSPSQGQAYEEYLARLEHDDIKTGAFYVEEKGYGYAWQTSRYLDPTAPARQAYARCKESARLSDCKLYAIHDQVLEVTR